MRNKGGHMYKLTIEYGNKRVTLSFDSVVAAKSEMWRKISAMVELGAIDDRHLVYHRDSLHVSCDDWFWSVDAA